MDIAITLPKNLWEKVVSGEKAYELRRDFPRKLRIGADKVYVILKGTTKVVGYFKVMKAFQVRIHDAVMHSRLIGVEPEWIARYLDYGNKSGYLWLIGDVTVFSPHEKSIVNLHLKSNPQSFCYIK